MKRKKFSIEQYIRLKYAISLSIFALLSNYANSQEIIIDNSDYPNGFNRTDGDWTPANMGKGGHYGEDYLHDGGGISNAAARWTPEIQIEGVYEIFMRWSAYENRPIDVPVEIHANGTSCFTTVNQQLADSIWVSLGIHNLSLGNENYVRITGASDGYTIADAVRFVLYDPIDVGLQKQLLVVDNVIDKARTTAFRKIGEVTKSPEPILDPADDPFETRIGYYGSVFSDGDVAKMVYNGVKGGRGYAESYDGGYTWVRTHVSTVIDDATFSTFPNGDSQNVNIFSKSNSEDWHNSTAISNYWGPRYIWTDNENALATWTPWIRKTGYYDVYIRWTAENNRSTAAPVEIDSSGVTIASLFIDQTQNGGEWYHLGRYIFKKDAKRASSGVKIRGAANGVVIADAVRFIYCGSQNATGSCDTNPNDIGHHGISDTHHWQNGTHIYKDLNETDPLKRYKSLHGMPDSLEDRSPSDIFLSYSPDGFSWWPYFDGNSIINRHSDSHNQIIFDSDCNCYRAYVRANKASLRRGTKMLKNDNLDEYPDVWDDSVPEWNFHPADKRQIYAFSIWKYEKIYFGFTLVYEDPIITNLPCDSIDLITKHSSDVMTAYLLTSYDGENWDFFFAETFQELIPRGGPGEFDKDRVNIFTQPLTTDNAHLLYYGGGNERHQVNFGACASYGVTQKIGMAELPLDRWGKRSDGITVTKPFFLSGNQLELNVNGDEVIVELMDAEGNVALAVSDVISANGNNIRPSWQSLNSLQPFSGQLVRLRFTIPNGDLYSFRVINGPVGINEELTEFEGFIQNYPNPFNPTTTIQYSLPYDSNVKIEIFDILGHRIRTLVNQRKNAGVYQIEWDGRNNYGRRVASGLYIYQIKAGSGKNKFEKAKNMILLR